MCSVEDINTKLFFQCLEAKIFVHTEIIRAKPRDNLTLIGNMEKEINRIYNIETGTNFPFGLDKNIFDVVALQWKSNFKDPKASIFSTVKARAIEAAAKHAAGHEYVEIVGNNGCIYTIGLSVDIVVDALSKQTKNVSQLMMNDFAFNRCKQKSKHCYKDIVENKRNHIYQSIDSRTGAVKETHTITDLDGCNQLCGNMTGIHDSDPNKYNPKGTKQPKYSDLWTRSSIPTYLTIEHLKFIREFVVNAELFTTNDPIDGEETKGLVAQISVNYNATESLAFKNPMAKAVFANVPHGELLCSQEDSANCRTFVNMFRDNISELMVFADKYFRRKVPNIYSEDLTELGIFSPTLLDMVLALRQPLRQPSVAKTEGDE
jgi:hypothetical protein